MLGGLGAPLRPQRPQPGQVGEPDEEQRAFLDVALTTGEVRTNVVGWGLEPDEMDPNVPVLTPKRIYVLGPPPAETGTWMDLP